MSIYSFIGSVYHFLSEIKRKRYIDGLQRKGLVLGKNVNIVGSFFFDPSHCFLISIGDNCTICPNVRLIAHDASTKLHLGYTKIGKIQIKENCFIGDSAIVLPGVTVGPNAIVGAGALVVKDVEPGTIVAGNPARVISSLEDYLTAIRTIREKKRIFSEDYYIERIDEDKRNEILESIGDTIGFIV